MKLNEWRKPVTKCKPTSRRIFSIQNVSGAVAKVLGKHETQVSQESDEVANLSLQDIVRMSHEGLIGSSEHDS